MKRCLLKLTTTLFFLLGLKLNALPLGNPSDPSLLLDGFIFEGHCADTYDPCIPWSRAISFRLGFWGDYVFDRHLQLDLAENNLIENSQLYTNAALLIFNFYDRIDLFTNLGSSNLFLDSTVETFLPPGAITEATQLVIESTTQFSWGIGVRGVLWEIGCTMLGAEAQYFRTCPSLRRLRLESLLDFYDEGFHIRYHEWQVGIGIAHRIHLLTPYIGLKWSGSRLDFNRSTIEVDETILQFHRLKNNKSWGYAIGVSLVDCDRFCVAIEGRFGDEKAAFTNCQLRF